LGHYSLAVNYVKPDAMLQRSTGLAASGLHMGIWDE
jgi:hypothetical protein